MSNYDFLAQRKRRQSLFIVEGNHEKNELVKLLLKIFPEIDIDIDNIIIYGTNVYMLLDDIEKEYTSSWYEDDIDLPYIVGKKKGYSQSLNKSDFSNIILIFDYEHHDPKFSEQKICRLQQYFNDSSDVGKLYINYPMVESYQHFEEYPDNRYEQEYILSSLRPGAKYKEKVRNSYVSKYVDLPEKLNDILKDRFTIDSDNVRQNCIKRILALDSLDNLEDNIKDILSEVMDDNLLTASYQFADILKKFEFLASEKNYWQYMRKMLSEVIKQCICKARKISGFTYETSLDEMENAFRNLDMCKILDEQNASSRDEINGKIWVLNTSVFIVPDYKYALIQS